MNTKYISSIAVKKISLRDEIYLVFAKKSKFSFILYSTEIQKAQPNFFLVQFDFCSVFIGYNIQCKHSLHLENDLESYFNEWNVRNQHLKKVF